MKRSAKILLSIGAAAIAVVLALLLVFHFTSVPSAAGEKTLSIQVIVSEEDTRAFTVTTDENYLGPALEAEGLIEGEKGQYGLFITTVDGVKADDSKKQWWCITKGGEDVYTGADSTPIADGDCFELTLSIY